MAASSTIHFELVSPERKLYDEPMAHVVIPGTEGYIGVGDQHMSYVVSLGFGTVTLYKHSMQDTDPQKIFIAGGFADISGKNCTVLAEEAVNIADLDRNDLVKKLEKLQADASKTESGADKAVIERDIAIVEAQIEALS